MLSHATELATNRMPRAMGLHPWYLPEVRCRTRKIAPRNNNAESSSFYHNPLAEVPNKSVESLPLSKSQFMHKAVQYKADARQHVFTCRPMRGNSDISRSSAALIISSCSEDCCLFRGREFAVWWFTSFERLERAAWRTTWFFIILDCVIGSRSGPLKPWYLLVWINKYHGWNCPKESTIRLVALLSWGYRTTEKSIGQYIAESLTCRSLSERWKF